MKITTAPFDALYGAAARGAFEPFDARDRHDAAALAVDRLLFEHVRDRVLAHEERAGEVDVEHALPLVAVDECARPAARDAGRGHDDVDAPVLGDDRRDERGDRVLVAHVELRERDRAVDTGRHVQIALRFREIDADDDARRPGANRPTHATPIPDAAPVTSATLPSSRTHGATLSTS